MTKESKDKQASEPADTFDDEVFAALEAGDYSSAFEKLVRLSWDSNLSAVGMCNLGVLYSNGLGVKKDAYKAFIWFMKAAEGKNISAFAKVGNAYTFGEGVEQSYDQAAEWYRKGAQAGDAESLNNLGALLCETGEPAKAIDYFERAAQLRYPEAFKNLGYCYSSGTGVVRNPYHAYVNYLFAAALDSEGMDCEDELEALSGELHQSDIERAKSELAKFVAPLSSSAQD